MGRQAFGLMGEGIRSPRSCDDILARQLTDINFLPVGNYKEIAKVLHKATM
jgi:hypothetical protein